MIYKLNVTEHAQTLLDDLVFYLLIHLNNESAANHLLSGIESIYKRLETNPWQFPLSNDSNLAEKAYRTALVPQMKYIIVYNIINDEINVLGIFHETENYQLKLNFNFTNT